QAIVHVDYGPDALLRGQGLAGRLDDVLEGLPRERVVEVDADAACADGRHDPVLAANEDLHPDLGVDLLTEELPLRPQFDEPRIAGSGPLVRGDDDLLRLRSEEHTSELQSRFD